MKKLIISFAALLLFMACEKEIELKQEESDPQIVLNSIFTVQDTLWMHVSESRDILYEGNLPVIENATAQLLDVNNNVIGNFNYDEFGNYYCPSVALSAGTTYGISVEAAGFNTVTSSALLPALVSVTSIDTVRAPNGELDFSLEIPDNGSESNFYQVSITFIGSFLDEFGEEIFFSDERCYTNEVYVVNGNAGIDGKRYGRRFLFSDDTFNGQTIDFKVTAEDYRFAEPGSYYLVELKSLNEDLFKYVVSYSKYKSADGNPFAEPVQIFDNITGGFGIFGASNTYNEFVWTE